MIEDEENIGFRYLLIIKLLPTFSYVSIVVSALLVRCSHKGHICQNCTVPLLLFISSIYLMLILCSTEMLYVGFCNFVYHENFNMHLKIEF